VSTRREFRTEADGLLSGLRRYQCPHCRHSFHRTDGQGLCDWSSPINLPIYSLLFRVHSNPPYEVAQQCRMEQDSSYLKYLLEEIRAELDHPSRRLTDIHNDTQYPEAELREFLRPFAEEYGHTCAEFPPWRFTTRVIELRLSARSKVRQFGQPT
jgi:3'-phosphoadenosine 5'-phosphosulfate sulfotransferase (PAPS reductase)/FAD synthetase